MPRQYSGELSRMTKKYDYDTIIIGAGIGGLVCGCYLAKAGLKTLIIEKGILPGGYCTSFKRKGYRFDTSVHYIGGVKTGVLSKILEDIKIGKDLKFNQLDPSDKIIMPDRTVYIRADPHDTIREFKKSFPEEKVSIDRFFQYMIQTSTQDMHRKFHSLSFEEVLNEFFNNDKLKSTVGSLLLGNLGLPPGKISGFAATIFFREFLLDPGYYPTGGMQAMSNCIADRFKSYGGELLLSSVVSEIICEDNHVNGVIIGGKIEIKSKYVVSGIDASQTFKCLLKKQTRETVAVDQLIPSGSIFVIYLGVNANLKKIASEGSNIWYFKDYNLDASYNYFQKDISKIKIPLFMMSFPSQKDLSWPDQFKSTIEIFTNAPFIDREYWAENKELFCEKLLSAAKNILPGIEKSIDLKIAASPYTFYRYTLNRNGAAYGWASTPNQLNSALFPQITSIANLFIVGHWAIMGAGQGGISTVALSGKNASKIIISRSNK